MFSASYISNNMVGMSHAPLPPPSILIGCVQALAILTENSIEYNQRRLEKRTKKIGDFLYFSFTSACTVQGNNLICYMKISVNSSGMNVDSFVGTRVFTLHNFATRDRIVGICRVERVEYTASASRHTR